MDTLSADVAIIGAGIVGLATAHEMLKRNPGMRLVVLEKETTVAAHQTGHNSGVIHSGIYYKPGTLKARLCTTGAAEMLRFIEAHGIPHLVCGKVIVATSDDEIPRLEELKSRGHANGIAGLREVGQAELREIEPLAEGIKALHVPCSAITDYCAVARKIRELVESLEGTVSTNAEVTGISLTTSEVRIASTSVIVEAKRAINCAGLHSDRLLRMTGRQPEVTIVPFRGEYYRVMGAAAQQIRTLIYPVPDPDMPFLGVHLTRMIDGRVLAGPNAVLAFAREGYERSHVDLTDMMELAHTAGFWRMAAANWSVGMFEMYRSLSERAFLKSVQKLVPSITAAQVQREGSGVRAQAVDRNGRFVDDFRFERDGPMLHVLNVPSPAATACFTIAKVIADECGLSARCAS